MVCFVYARPPDPDFQSQLTVSMSQYTLNNLLMFYISPHQTFSPVFGNNLRTMENALYK